MQPQRTTGRQKPKKKAKAPSAPKVLSHSSAAAAHEAAATLALRGTQNATRVQRLTNGVGLLSVGLGLLGLAAPGSVATLIGVRPCPRTRLAIRGASLGQLATGIGVLANRHTAPWLWMRVVSDLADVALLANGAGRRGSPPRRALLAGAGLVGMAALGGAAALRAQRLHADGAAHGIYVNAAITIQRTPQEVYAVWRDFQNLPRFMSHLESATVDDAGIVGLRARLPAGLKLEWRARITEDTPGSKIAWASLPESQLHNHGAVTFTPAPGERGTQVHVVLNYEPIGGALGHAFSKLFGTLPLEQLRGDLRRLKQILETGDLVHSDASVHKGPHPARPSEESQQLAEQRSKGGVS
jgi:uncharacterized membrane protein